MTWAERAAWLMFGGIMLGIASTHSSDTNAVAGFVLLAVGAVILAVQLMRGRA